ncbi:hypothetical protein JWJ90_13560 [Desulfobulbus rhabdoformis]|uniref:HK97 gp10 family phage protein n=1 Tax=Desulfobulbus rhabdoformis TaxID=34032 RepID=UPI00196581CC|nr:hypothetical protein [Desulfobulbus rhabdoformis]MBM9615306.1 hypothetical protein [Desulfobulbus rhabdoformis]
MKTASVSLVDWDAGIAAQLAQNTEVIDALLSDVADVIRDDAKATSAFIDRTHNLRKSIGKRRSKFINGGYIVKATGRNRGTGATRARGFHAFLVEFGHVKVLWGKRTSEHVPPHPFMRPAVERGRLYATKRINELRK